MLNLKPPVAITFCQLTALRRGRSRNPALPLLIGLLAVLPLSGCGGSNPGDTTVPAPAQQETAVDSQAVDGPPGFLDPAPPPPESDTLILSGGTLITVAAAHSDADTDADTDADIDSNGLFDAVVVVRDGVLMNFGRRGTIDVPADSVGIDTSGQFITPEGPFEIGAPVTLNVFSQRPKDGSPQPRLSGRLEAGQWQPVVIDGN